MLTQEHKELLTDIFTDEWTRLNTLYHIVDKEGNKKVFKANWAQKELYYNLHNLNIVLKARQLGISTFIGLYFLDKCLFEDNISCGMICDSRENAKQFFKRIKFAYDQLPEFLKAIRSATVDSAQELVFSNGSSIRVGTSMRGSTLNYLHVSEFGKICAHYPEKAREIITGSLNTLAAGQFCCIESTAEGQDGEFYDMCRTAQRLKEQNKKLTKLDYKFHFFPWWKEPLYILKDKVAIEPEKEKYFAQLKHLGIELTEPQKQWYVSVEKTQSEDMKREYPSTPEESFQAATDGAYYHKQLSLARMQGRISTVYHNEELPVHTAWDLGYADDTVIWLFQMEGQEIHIFDYIEGSGEPLTYYLKLLKAKGYIYGTHLVPHDANNTEYGSGFTRIETARKAGFTLTLTTDVGVDEGIDATRLIFNRFWFDEVKCAKGIHHLDNYKRAWNTAHGCWSSRPNHDEHSHASDALRYLSVGLDKIGTRLISDAEVERLRDIHQPRFS